MTQVWYHENCADGFGAAYAAWLVCRDTAKYIPVQYGQPMPPAEPGDRVFILDFSYSVAELQRLAVTLGRDGGVEVIDHHKTAAAELDNANQITWAGNVAVTFDMTQSGCMLAWKRFHKDTPPPRFFEYLQDRDLWQWRLPKSREINAAIRAQPMGFLTWQRLAEMTKLDCLAETGEAILRSQKELVNLMVSRARQLVVNSVTRELMLCGLPEEAETCPGPHKSHALALKYYMPATNATCLVSEVCEALLAKYPNWPVVAAYFDTEDGKRVFSLRSRNDFDCSVIAKAMGGGGHAQASGFTTRGDNGNISHP